MRLAKKILPDVKDIVLVHGDDLAMSTLGDAAMSESRKSGLCIAGRFIVPYFNRNYTHIVDGILELAEKGLYTATKYHRVIQATSKISWSLMV